MRSAHSLLRLCSAFSQQPAGQWPSHHLCRRPSSSTAGQPLLSTSLRCQIGFIALMCMQLQRSQNGHVQPRIPKWPSDPPVRVLLRVYMVSQWGHTEQLAAQLLSWGWCVNTPHCFVYSAVYKDCTLQLPSAHAWLTQSVYQCCIDRE